MNNETSGQTNPSNEENQPKQRNESKDLKGEQMPLESGGADGTVGVPDGNGTGNEESAVSPVTNGQTAESNGSSISEEILKSHSELEFEEVEPWPEKVDGGTLLDSLVLIFKMFLVLPKWAAEMLALWTLHTYAFQWRQVSTYIGIESPLPRCGKTTLLAVLSELVNRAVTAASVSSPAFYRVISEMQPTLLIDEADRVLKRNNELRSVLNAGYTRKTAYVLRVSNKARGGQNPSAKDQVCEGSGGSGKRNGNGGVQSSSLARFSCWCPKAMAGIGRLPETLADRCILIRMDRKMPHEECERLRNLDTTELRRQCMRFALDNGKAIAMAKPELPSSLNDRAADIWEPLLALADLAGGSWPEKARQAALSLSASGQETHPIGSLLLDILLLFVTLKESRVFSRTLVEWLNDRQDRRWAETTRGKAVDEMWLATQLRPFGIRPKTIWIGGAAAKGYLQQDFKEVFRRYIPKSELEVLQAEVQEKQEPNTGPEGSERSNDK